MVEWRFCGGFCDFRCAERGELRGKTWWSCGETVVEITSGSVQLKHANFSHIFSIFFWRGAEGRIEDGLSMVRGQRYHAASAVSLCRGIDLLVKTLQKKASCIPC
jgi:hypothetical protein